MNQSLENDKVFEIRNLENDDLRFRLSWFLQRFLLAPGLMFYTRIVNQTEFIGLENLEELKGKSFLVCPNHTSSFDIWMAFEVGFQALSSFFSNSHYLCGLGAAERLGPGPVRSFCVHAGVLPVDRSKGLEQYALQDAVRLINERKKEIACLIYPEGTRSKSGYLARDYKAGVGWIQSMTSVPVLPVYQVNYNKLPAVGQKLQIIIDKPMYFEATEDQRNNPGRWFEITSEIMERLYSLEKQYHPNPEGIPAQTEKGVSSKAGRIFAPGKSMNALAESQESFLVLQSSKGVCVAEENAKIPGNWEELGVLPSLPENLPTTEVFCKKLAVSQPIVVSAPRWLQLSSSRLAESASKNLLVSIPLVDQTMLELEEELDGLFDAGVSTDKIMIDWRYHPSNVSLNLQRARLLHNKGIRRLCFFGFLATPLDIVENWNQEDGLKVWVKSSIPDALIRLALGFEKTQKAELEAIVLQELEQFNRDSLRLDQSFDLLVSMVKEQIGKEVLLGVGASYLDPDYAFLLYQRGVQFFQFDEVFRFFLDGSYSSKFSKDASWVIDPSYFEMGVQIRVANSNPAYLLLSRKLEKIYQSSSNGTLSNEDLEFVQKSSGASSLEELAQRASEEFEDAFPDLVALSVTDSRSRLALCFKFLLFKQAEGLTPVARALEFVDSDLLKSDSGSEFAGQYMQKLKAQARQFYARCLGMN